MCHFRSPQDFGVDIGAEATADIVDGNADVMLTLVGNIIRQVQKYKIGTPQATNDEVKEFLLRWYASTCSCSSCTGELTRMRRALSRSLSLARCTEATKGRDSVDIRDFAFSFRDGLAFCALICAHAPAALSWSQVDATNKHRNLSLAFSVAQEALRVPELLSTTDFDYNVDEESVVTYLLECYISILNASQQQQQQLEQQQHQQQQLFFQQQQQQQQQFLLFQQQILQQQHQQLQLQQQQQQVLQQQQQQQQQQAAPPLVQIPPGMPISVSQAIGVGGVSGDGAPPPSLLSASLLQSSPLVLKGDASDAEVFIIRVYITEDDEGDTCRFRSFLVREGMTAKELRDLIQARMKLNAGVSIELLEVVRGVGTCARHAIHIDTTRSLICG